jgi:hypothetical protein
MAALISQVEKAPGRKRTITPGLMTDYVDKDDTNSGDARRAGSAPIISKEEGDLSEAVALLRNHPRWAIWLPVGNGDWAAIRPASSRPPSPELPTIWVHADTASELARLMDAADEQISGRAGPTSES